MTVLIDTGTVNVQLNNPACNYLHVETKRWRRKIDERAGGRAANKQSQGRSRFQPKIDAMS